MLSAGSPGTAKKRGQQVTLRAGWNTGLRVLAMQRVLTATFEQQPLREKLRATGDLELVETNHWHDQFWGSCYCEQHAHFAGTNMLGELLMALRTHQQNMAH